MLWRGQTGNGHLTDNIKTISVPVREGTGSYAVNSYVFVLVFLPLGISFFTFQQLSYVIDCYHGKAKGYSFTDYALFILYFPQLAAGPIATHDEMIHQFADREREKPDWEHFSSRISAEAAFRMMNGEGILGSDHRQAIHAYFDRIRSFDFESLYE